MAFEFDDDTAVTPLGGGAYAGELTARWNVGDKPNGGYLLAVALRAAGEELPLPHPFTATAHYLRPATPGPVSVDVEVVRAGRSLATGDVRLHQSDAEVIRVLTTFGDLNRLDGPTNRQGAPPELPPVDQCLRGRGTLPDGRPVAIGERFEVGMHPDTLGWLRGAPTGRAEVGGWIRFVDGREADPLALTLIVDAMPPGVFDLGAMGWVPTIELTVHVRAVPAPGWLRMWSKTRFLQNGYLEEDVEIWDAADQLVAQSRQLARLTSGQQGPH